MFCLIIVVWGVCLYLCLFCCLIMYDCACLYMFDHECCVLLCTVVCLCILLYIFALFLDACVWLLTPIVTVLFFDVLCIVVYCCSLQW